MEELRATMREVQARSVKAWDQASHGSNGFNRGVELSLVLKSEGVSESRKLATKKICEKVM